MSNLRLTSAVTAVMCLFVLPSYGLERNRYRLTNNQYGNLLLAIGDNVPDDQRLISRIKEILTKASETLFIATNRRAYLKNVTILIPREWKRNNSWPTSTTEEFQKANVIIASPNPASGDNPYVHQIRGCGEPGEYMHLTPNYVLKDEVAANFGYSEEPYGRTIVHEFAHLRWGVFDEHPLESEGYPHFYYDSEGNVDAVKCSKEVTGSLFDRVTSSDDCQLEETGLPDSNCIFQPDLTSKQEATSSLMDNYKMKSVTKFCDKEHNTEAPNKHNRKCNSKSVWEVMLEHADFKGNNNPPLSRLVNVDTAPNFKVVQKSEKHIVLVIDTSGSMSGNQRLLKARQASTQYLKTYVENGAHVAIVAFASAARILHGMRTIRGKSDRESLINSLPTVSSGGTCIGDALKKGLEVLDNNGAASGGYILLLSDGKDGCNTQSADLKRNLITKGVIVDTIRFSDGADKMLDSFAKETGGIPMFSSDGDDSASLKNNFEKLTLERTPEKAVVKVMDELVTLKGHAIKNVTFNIDGDIGSNTAVYVTWTSARGFIVSIVTPDGSKLDMSAVTYNDASKSLQVVIPGKAVAGIWTIVFNNRSPSKSKVQVSVTSRAREETVEPVRLSVAMSTPGEATVDLKDLNKSRVAIYATLQKGYQPVIGAKVVAIIKTDTSATHQPLQDGGAGADANVEDGVYSGYFTNFTGNGRYSVSIRASFLPNITKIKTSSAANQSIDTHTPNSKFGKDLWLPTLTDADQFSRDTTGSSFVVVNQPAPTRSKDGTTEQADLFPPSAILDLELIGVSYANDSVSLQWTAVGDDLDQGKATRYDLRVSTNFSEIKSNFSKCRPVTQAMVLVGNLSAPLPAGSIETFTVQLNITDANATYVFAVKAIDDQNKTGSMSNLVTAAFVVVSLPLKSRQTGRETATRKAMSDESVTNTSCSSCNGCYTAFVLLTVLINCLCVTTSSWGSFFRRSQAFP